MHPTGQGSGTQTAQKLFEFVSSAVKAQSPQREETEQSESELGFIVERVEEQKASVAQELQSRSQSDLVQIINEVQAASDAEVVVDGITYTRTSNAISDIITGVTLNLESVGAGTLTISPDNTAIAGNIQDFVDAFNELVSFIDEQTEFNAETFTTGVLFGNSSVQSLETSLRRIATGQVTGLSGTFEFLSQIGITTQDDGQLFLDDVILDQAITSDITNVVELFTSTNGIITQLESRVDLLLDSSQKGPLTSELDSLTESIDDLNDTLLRMDDRLELFERKIRQEFINLEIILARLDAQRNAFQQALQSLGSAFDRT